MEIVEVFYAWELKDPDEIAHHSRIHAHQQNLYELHYFLKGQGYFQTEGGRFPLERGLLTYTPPGVIHNLEISSKNRGLSYYALLFKLSSHEIQNHPLFKAFREDKAYYFGSQHRLFFERIKQKSESENTWQNKAAIHQLWTLLYDCVSGELGRRQQDYVDNILEPCLKFLQENIYKSIQLKDLEQQLGRSAEHISRVFKENMQVSPIRYHLNLRLEAAKNKLLEKPDWPLHRLAEQFHFYNEFHFSRSFKQRFGLPPRAYRKKNL